VVEEAYKWLRLQLRTAAAAEARAYLSRRGLTPDAIERWEIGFAPDQRQGLFQALTAKGIAPDMIVASGLCAKPDDGGAPYDRFRDRITFPIRDGRGRAISLAGRAMAADARAKYLNGPESELFDKGRNLFNLHRARESAGKGATAILAEGYMDVIALSEAGFPAALAPMGTAVTEDQLRLLWRVGAEPVVALDGDKAGIKAAHRLIDLALPLIEAGQSLRFAILPGGMDPDELIKANGPAAMQTVLDQAQPMVRLLWARETEGQVFDSPERKAALDRRLRMVLTQIKDPSLRGHYGEEVKALRWDLFGQSRPRRGAPRIVPMAPVATSRASTLAVDDGAADRLLAAVLIATLIRHPALVARFESDLETLPLADASHRAMLSGVLRHGACDDLSVRIAADVGDALETLMTDRHVRIAPPVTTDDTEFATMCAAEALAKLTARAGAAREIEEATHDMTGLVDEGLTWRLSQAAAARNAAGRTTRDDDAGEDRAAMSGHLQALIDSEAWVKRRR
jgi:DNA primase